MTALLAVTITLDLWLMLKVLWGVLCVLSILALVKGTLPDNEPSPFWDTIRWLTWIPFIILTIVFLIRALVV